MVDYGPGDEIVCVKPTKRVYIQHATYICVAVGPTTHPKRYRYKCPYCDTRMEDASGVWTNVGKYEACSCLFRKKLDFKKLCNVDETIKIKEDA